MSKNKVPYLVQGKNIILVIDNKSHTISKDTHIAYAKIIDALKSEDWDALRDLVEPRKAIVNFGSGYVTMKDDKVFWKGQPFNNALATRMIEMFADGFPIDPMVRFMENLMANPSKRSVDQVYGFLEKNDLPITPDGYFLAYKRVNDNYMDIHSGTISNHIGAVVTMDRNLVDDNPESHCSTGLHFCSESYLDSFGSASQPVMILKISPADVVSIPTDYNGAKGRCCKYEVVAQVKGDPKDAFAKIVNGDYSPAQAPIKTAKTAKKVVATPVTTFGIDDLLAGQDFEDDDIDANYDINDLLDGSDEYSVVHWKYHHEVKATGVTLEEARQLVAKNERQKKAKLVILDDNGGVVQ